MIFRGRAPEISVWQRFRSGVDGFTFTTRDDGLYEAHVSANAEYVIELLYNLSEQLPPAVDVCLIDHRTQQTWSGEDVALPDVRNAVARMKIPLGTYGGIEMTLYTPDDQLTLTPQLDLYAYARSDRWLYLLQGQGIEEYTGRGELIDRNQPWDTHAAPALSEAVEAAAQRLGLRRQ